MLIAVERDGWMIDAAWYPLQILAGLPDNRVAEAATLLDRIGMDAPAEPEAADLQDLHAVI